MPTLKYRWLSRSGCHELPARIGAADLCLGVFGIGDKTNRVIPNKVYQSLACDRPVITMAAQAYPELRSQNEVLWAAAGDPASIAKALSDALSTQPVGGVDRGVAFATCKGIFPTRKSAKNSRRYWLGWFSARRRVTMPLCQSGQLAQGARESELSRTDHAGRGAG